MTDAVATLQAAHSIPNIATILSGENNLPKIHITTPEAAADIYLHGAQVTAWQPAQTRQDVLFLSSKSLFQAGKAIRGGIPVCWPWFRAKADDPHAPAHGLVRTRIWNLDAITHGEQTTVTLSIRNSPETEALWPYAFHLQLRITVGAVLQLELTATNTGSEPFRFEEALHTYFHVASIHEVKVEGLVGTLYLDNNNGNREMTPTADLTFTGATDNAYLHTQSPLDLIDPRYHRTLRTEKTHSRSTIAWNPWQAAAAKLPDLGDDEWTCMACVEAANILDNAITLAAGERHTMTSTISVRT